MKSNRESIFGVETKDGQISKDFVELTLEMRRLGQTIGVEILPFRDPSVPHFSSLPVVKKEQIYNTLKTSVEICHSTLSNGQKLNDSKALLWNTFKHFGWTPSSDLFTKISQEDVIEIFDMEHIQIFRNFNFFKYCSYTLEDVFCRPWVELFIRFDDEVKARLIGSVNRLLTSGTHETVKTNIGIHQIQESKSVFRHVLDVDVKFLSTLKGSDHKNAAYIAVETAKLVIEISEEEQNRRLRELFSFQEPSEKPMLLRLVRPATEPN